MRIALGIEYCGKSYSGFQRQENAVNIQSELEKALSKVADHEVRLVCSGRTDSGVHAFEQVIHFESESNRPLKAWLLGANSILPTDIRVLWANEVSDEFHARFSAKSRRYHYYILNRQTASAVFDARVTWHYYKLDAEKMHEAAQYLLGEHDFTSFRASGCQSKSAHRNVEFINIARKDDLICIDIQANSFLYHMVRNLVGSLIKVGEGVASPDWIKELLAKKDRTQAGITAPADGLYFHSVQYDTAFSNKQSQPLKSLPMTLAH